MTQKKRTLTFHDELPPTKQGGRQRSLLTDDVLEQLAQSPGSWAPLAEYATANAAGSSAARLRVAWPHLVFASREATVWVKHPKDEQ